MKLDPIALSIPAFFILIGVELLWARLTKRAVYRFNDSINDLACGVLSQVLGLFAAAILLGNYIFVFDHARLAGPWSTDDTLAWALCFLGVDFFYYWYHRFSHECALGWAAHVVHHQSEEYNLTVALRQSAFQPWQSHLFYLPLAVAGFPPVMFATCAAFNTLYQFWIHTRLIDRLGPLEWIINTPSHHRVHHGSDAKYLDRNYAGTFILWDRLFGTFVPETTEPHYGVLEPLRSWNPLWANVHTPWLLLQKAARMPGVWNKLQVFFRAPGWMPAGSAGPSVEEKAAALVKRGKYDVNPPRGGVAYVLLHFVLALVVTVALLFAKGSTPAPLLAMGAVFIAWTLLNLGGVFEQKVWLRVSEPARLVGGLAMVWLLGVGAQAVAVLAVFAAPMIWWVLAGKAQPAQQDAASA